MRTTSWLRVYNAKLEHSGEYCHGKNAPAHFPGFQTPSEGENAQLLRATSSSDVEGRRAGAHGAAAQDGLCQIKVSARTGQDADHVVSSIEVHARTDDRTYPDCNQKRQVPSSPTSCERLFDVITKIIACFPTKVHGNT